MPIIRTLSSYSDSKGNTIIFDGPAVEVMVNFKGRNNALKVDSAARINLLEAAFDSDNGYVEIGSCNIMKKGLLAHIRIGLDSSVRIGNNVTCTSRCMISAVERSHITIGDECMISSSNEIKTDDSHPIFDVTTGKRLNMPRDIVIGNHVWLARRAVVLGGSSIGDGSVIGYSAVAKGSIPNNCIAVGVPARVIKRNIAWERPHLSLVKPHYKPDASFVKKSAYWNLTEDSSAVE
ncbi:acyltransferase [Alcaligenaceae bacterium]|nr:acyltransferase [Alcaligenaceae bacterium]